MILLIRQIGQSGQGGQSGPVGPGCQCVPGYPVGQKVEFIM